MSAGGFERAVGLPALAVVLVAAVVGVQWQEGGGRFEPLKPADPCVEREVSTRSEGIEGLTELLVLIGVDNAACTLDVSREALILELAQTDDPTDAQVDALKQGLLDAVRRLDEDERLPASSELLDEALESADLNSTVEALVKRIPDSIIDREFATEDVLTRAITDLDVRELLTNIDDRAGLEARVEEAVTEAVEDVARDRVDGLVERIRDFIPGLPDVPGLPDLPDLPGLPSLPGLPG